jgi:hypothetical protein
MQRELINLRSLALDKQMLKEYPKFPDEYIEKMARFYTSEFAVRIFPDIHSKPFEEWLLTQYMLSLKNIG